jgi:hypothetical protein
LYIWSTIFACPLNKHRLHSVRASRQLIIFSGLSGAGKSPLAEAIGRRFSVLYLQKIGWKRYYCKVSVLPPAQTSRGFNWLSIVYDSRAVPIYARTVCDPGSCRQYSQYSKNMAASGRPLPGWHQLEWSDVEKVRGDHSLWEGTRLVLDMVDPFNDDLARAVAYCE